MLLFLISMLIINIFAGFTVYVTMFKSRKLFNDRFAMIMSIATSSILNLSLAMLIFLLIPIHFTLVAILTITVGGMIGIKLGSLVKFQSMLTGFFHGVMGAIMGTMLGAVIENPVLCNLPGIYTNQIDQNTIYFGLFTTFLVLITSGLVRYSLRV